ncbi:MAG: hypothetical protein AAF566_00340 [Pseudomonadota bacterium]
MPSSRHRVLVLAVSLLTVSPAWAEEPLSAIDWLSNSIAVPSEVPELPGQSITKSAAPGAITVTPLDGIGSGAVGLLPPSATGLPRALWGPATVEDVLARLRAVPADLLPSLDGLLTMLLLAEANPPRGRDGDDRLLLARVDRLLDHGDIERAEALLERAGVDTLDRFRRLFDIALLLGTENAACERMRDRPEFSPTYPARIFCLARGGDWQAAALTLETAETLGILTPAEDVLLARFLDSEIIGDAGVDWRAPTPLTFRMLEAIGEPVPTGPLPVAFAWADLRPTRGWKAQIEAAERLARAGVLSGNQLFALYLRQRPSASGGVWERAKAVQNLQAALAGGNPGTISEVLPDAWAHMRRAGLAHAFAQRYGAEIADLPLPGETSSLALRIGLLSPAFERVALSAAATQGQEAFLVALARGLPQSAVAPDMTTLAVREGFLATSPPAALAPLIAEGRSGEAILKALTLFAEGAAGDPDGISDAIATLRALGLEAVARRASLELHLLDSAN